MITRRFKAALLAAVVLTTGCATVDKVPFAPESKQKIKTIAVIEVPEPEKYFLNPGMAPGGAALYMFGALGGLILGGIEASRFESATDEFTAALRPTNPDVARHWTQSLIDTFQSKGYEVTRLPRLPTKTEGKDADCASIAGKFDAVLLSSISPGFAVESGVEPRIFASLRLTSSNCADTYFSDAYLYSAKSFGNATHVPRDARFSFATREALIADPQTAKTALRTGLAEIAKRAASGL